MKKLLILTLIPLVLGGCKNKKGGSGDIVLPSDLTVIAPTGAPAIAMSAFAELDGFETTTDPSTVVPLVAKGQYDVAVLPTNVGVTAINNSLELHSLLFDTA